MLGALTVTLLTALLVGCGPDREVSSVEPMPSQEVNNPELGSPAVDPLTFGPGEKDSPAWGPSGERVAFIVDGYVSDKPVSSRNSNRRTTQDLGAERVVWPASGEELVILGYDPSSGADSGDESEPETYSLYATRSEEGQLEVERLARDALALSSPSGGEPLVAALESAPYESTVAVIDPDTGELSPYPEPIQGRVTELSVAADGGRALATVAVPSDAGPDRYEVHVLDLESGESGRLARLDESLEAFGAPQQTSGGVYYVAGEREEEQREEQAEEPERTGESEIRYRLYRLAEGSYSPEPASGVGEDFVASSIKASPDGGRLALLGRRDSASATNLYVLDLSDESLTSATSNENMEIKTGTNSLAWSPDGENVAIVARSDISGPRVYNGPASSLLANFYNLYEVPADRLRASEREAS